jgi:hypothetical protein
MTKVTLFGGPFDGLKVTALWDEVLMVVAPGSAPTATEPATAVVSTQFTYRYLVEGDCGVLVEIIAPKETA